MLTTRITGGDIWGALRDLRFTFETTPNREKTDEGQAGMNDLKFEGESWCVKRSEQTRGGAIELKLQSSKPLEYVSLVAKNNATPVDVPRWTENTAIISRNEDGSYTVTAKLPAGASDWFVNAHSGNQIASID